ncbi:MAG TPA: DinB family protein [Puia sp.]|nr:DinB family protein [Puia sp.]
MKFTKLFNFSAFMLATTLICDKGHSQSLSTSDIKTFMVKEWERAKSYTVDYLNTMPADKYSFKPVDSIRSFAQQMLHLAEANCFLMNNATDISTPSWAKSDLEHSPGAQNKDSVMYYVTASYDYCRDAVKNTDLNKWGESKKIFGFENTRFGMMMKTFEHQTHHRGQTTIYIRLQGIRPPQERLF